MIAFWILSILSILHFALAAPVAVREILEVLSNVVDSPEDGVAAWEKRMDAESQGSNQPQELPYTLPEYEIHSDHFELESDGRTPDRWFNVSPYDKPNSSLDSDTNYNSDTDDDPDGGGGNQHEGNGGNGGNEHEGNGGNDNGGNNGNNDNNGGIVDNHGAHDAHDDDSGGYDGDNDTDNGGSDTDNERMPENPSPGPGPESEQLAIPELMSDAEKLLGPLRFRPRSRCYGYAKER